MTKLRLIDVHSPQYSAVILVKVDPSMMHLKTIELRVAIDY